MPDYDYEGYVKSLEKILEGVSKDYWTVFIDVNRHQLNVGRTYLWVSVVLFGIYLTAFDKFLEKIMASNILLSLVSFCFISVILAFITCLYAIPPRGGYKCIPREGWGEFSHDAYRRLKNGSPQLYAGFLTDFIAKIDHAFAHNTKTNDRRASLLRKTSTYLMASFILALITFLMLAVSEISYNSQEVNPMSEENKTEPTQSQVQENTWLDVPEPPPPANIGGEDRITLSGFFEKNRFIADNANEQ